MLYNSVKSGKLKDDFDEDGLPTHWHVYLAPIDGKDVPVLTYKGKIYFKDKEIIQMILPDYSVYFKNEKFHTLAEPIKELVLSTATHI